MATQKDRICTTEVVTDQGDKSAEVERVLTTYQKITWFPWHLGLKHKTLVRFDRQLFEDRLVLEWTMRTMLPTATSFILLVFLFLLTLLYESPVSEIHSINSNLIYHFGLEEVGEINDFTGIYMFMYGFIEKSGRFDPLDRQRYVDRVYFTENDTAFGGSVFNHKSVGEPTYGIQVNQTNDFFATTALLIRPQIWMNRANLVRCEHFATLYDRLYTITRYTRGLFRGHSLPGGWQPAVVNFREAADSPNRPIMIREPSTNPPPKKSSVKSGYESNWGSDLLTCVDRSSLNRTMSRSHRDIFKLQQIEYQGDTWFGDFFPETTDVLAYMGYNVYSHRIDRNMFPRCFMENKYTADGDVEYYRQADGTVVENGTKVTLEDVEDRCERTPNTWHDVQTREIRLVAILYTPVLEIFTRVKVQFNVEASGIISSFYELNSFQQLKNTDRYYPWLALTITELVMCIVQFVLIAHRIWLEKWGARKFPNGTVFDGTNILGFVISIGLNCAILYFLIYQIVTKATQNLWGDFEQFFSLNPFADGGSEEALQWQKEIFSDSKEFRRLQIFGLLIVLASFAQMLEYLTMHPQLGIVAETLMAITKDLTSFGTVCVLIMAVLAMTGFWAFGQDIEELSSPWSALAITFVYGISGGDITALHQTQHDVLSKFFIVVWELLVSLVVFFFLLNFLLAIVVDGYAAIKEKIANSSSYTCFWDTVLMMVSTVHASSMRVPPRPMILHHVRTNLPDEQTVISAADLAPIWVQHAKLTPARAAIFAEEYMRFYWVWVPKLRYKGEPGAEEQERKEKDGEKDGSTATNTQDIAGKVVGASLALEESVTVPDTYAASPGEVWRSQRSAGMEAELLEYKQLCLQQQATMQEMKKVLLDVKEELRRSREKRPQGCQIATWWRTDEGFL